MVRTSRPLAIVLLTTAAFIIFVATYLFQRTDIFSLLGFKNIATAHPNVVFSVNRYLRLILNDSACLLVIIAFFTRRHLSIAFGLFLLETLVLLPLYLVVKLSLEGDTEISSPLLSQIHRLIVNPILMLLLILGFIYQEIATKKAGGRIS